MVCSCLADKNNFNTERNRFWLYTGSGHHVERIKTGDLDLLVTQGSFQMHPHARLGHHIHGIKDKIPTGCFKKRTGKNAREICSPIAETIDHALQ